MITVGGHTFEETLLTDGCIIDVGCRGFEFANHFAGMNKYLAGKIYCIDPDPMVFVNISNPHGMVHLNVAISDKAGDSEYYENGEATCLKQLHHFQDHRIKPCKTITMDDLYAITGTNVDILKLDCEGAEYIILGESFRPIPKQISVEFHNHCVPAIHQANYKAIVERLSKDYTMHNDVWEARHGAGFSFWDTLFIKK